jgi:uncharacterized protein YaaR (DUF327 family)
MKETMQIKSHSNSLLATTLLAALCCSFLLLTPNISQAGWEQVMNAASNLSPEAQKKRAEINKRVAMDDKKVKEALDKVFKDQFEKVFEGDLKPSQVYDVLQFVEAASAGDLDAAMKTGGEFMVGLIPGVGQYISAMKSLAKGIRMAEQVWINELYQTSAYNNLFSIVNPALRENFYSDSFRPPEPFFRSYGGAPYIPSFLIRYAPDAPEAAIMGRLQAHMQYWEAAMYEQWRAVDGGRPVTQLQQPPWAARLRSAYGKVLTDREIFNRFLYRIVEPDRNKILENLRWIYLRPAAMKAARQEKQKINAAVEQALAKISFDDGKETVPVLTPRRDTKRSDPRRQPKKMTKINPPSPGTSKTDSVVSSGHSIFQPAHLQGKFWVVENISYSTGAWREGNQNLIYYVEKSPVKPAKGKVLWGPGTEEDARKTSKRMLENFENRGIWWIQVRGAGENWILYDASGRKPEERKIGWGPGNRADAQRALERLTTGQKTASDHVTPQKKEWYVVRFHYPEGSKVEVIFHDTKIWSPRLRQMQHDILLGPCSIDEAKQYIKEMPASDAGKAKVTQKAEKEKNKKIYTRLIALRDRMVPEIRRLNGDYNSLTYTIKNRKDELRRLKSALERTRNMIKNKPQKQRTAAEVSGYKSQISAYNQKVHQSNQFLAQRKQLAEKRNPMAHLLKNIDTALQKADYRQALDIANNSPVAREYGWQTFNP